MPLGPRNEVSISREVRRLGKKGKRKEKASSWRLGRVHLLGFWLLDTFELRGGVSSPDPRSKLDPFHMVYLRGPVRYWEYSDVAGILFGCLILVLPLTAYVMGDDED